MRFLLALAGLITSFLIWTGQAQAQFFDIPTPKFQKIEIDLGKQELVAYQDNVEFLRSKISSGVFRHPTPRGKFSVLKKIPLMDYIWNYGPGNPENYNLPRVKHNLMFKKSFYIHGAYWHHNFGFRMSHGCINTPLDVAEKLYNWADVGTEVYIYDSTLKVVKKK